MYGVSAGSMRDHNFSHRHVQSVLFPIKYEEKACKMWLKYHGFKYDNVRKTNDHLRFQQFEPLENAKNRIFKLPNSPVEFVLEYNSSD